MSLCWSSSLRAQLFFDDFEDGQLDQGTLWYGDTSLVKHSQGYAAGTRGALMWDGYNDNGQKVPIGRYIAYIEASDAAGRSIERHKTTVVVAR